MRYLITWTDRNEMLELEATERDTAVLAACRLSQITQDRAVAWEDHGDVGGVGQRLIVHIVGYVNGAIIER